MPCALEKVIIVVINLSVYNTERGKPFSREQLIIYNTLETKIIVK